MDMGDFSNDVLVLTGSLSMRAKGETEFFPGRRGGGRDYLLHPLCFRDFLTVADPQLAGRIEPIASPSLPEVMEKCERASSWSDEISSLFEKYLECGGFPPAVRGMLSEGRVPEEVKDTFLSAFLSDLVRLGKSEALAKRVLTAVIEKLPSPFSLNSVAKEFEIRSHKTVFHYLDLLEKLFLLKNVYFIEPNKLLEVYRKERKVHLTDPFLYRIFSEWCFVEPPTQASLVESVVVSHLSRRFRVGYWRDGAEIDAVLPDLGFGIEVKWGRGKAEGRKGVGKIREILILTKEELSREVPCVPASLFLACFDPLKYEQFSDPQNIGNN